MLTREPLAPGTGSEGLLDAAGGGPWRFLLDSSRVGGTRGCYSFAGGRPFLLMSACGRRVTLRDARGQREFAADPFEVLQELLVRYRIDPETTAGAPVGPCAVGYLGYELGRHIERLPATTRDDLGLPDLALAFYDEVLVVDHRRGRSERIRGRVPGVRPAERAPLAFTLAPAALPAAEGPNFSRAAYLRAVERVKRYILDGDVFQANISQRFAVRSPTDPWHLYRALRHANPAPFSAYLDFGAFQVLSSSPERFLRVDGRRVETRPIKGTCGRVDDPVEDRARARALSRSEKDRAELSMIVDLERNDLGRVCEYGSVRVEDALSVESYAAVHHLVATVTGELRRDVDLVDLLRATFPGGSITGAPKIRAMEIIDELEPHARSPYTGAIGYLGLDGRADLNVAIRTLVQRDGWTCFHVGGGIVADSQPDAEYRETLDKGRALMDALRSVGCRIAV